MAKLGYPPYKIFRFPIAGVLWVDELAILDQMHQGVKLHDYMKSFLPFAKAHLLRKAYAVKNLLARFLLFEN